MASNNFINECKKGANANRLGKIIVDGLENPITNSDNLKSFSIDNGCYVDGNIIGTIYIKKFTGEFVAISNDSNLIDKQIQVQIGVKYTDNTAEYLEMGKYTIERPKSEETADNTKITAYDNLMNKINDKYVCGIEYENSNITMQDLYIDVCNQLELIPKTASFLNDDIPITNNPFTNGESNWIVLQTIAKIACSFVTIDMVNDKIDLSWLSNSENPDYTFEQSDYATLEGGIIQFGPINSVTIKNSQIDSENVTQNDSESIQLNGEHSIVISEDYILYNSTLRQQAITAIFNRLNGFQYVDFKLTTYYGKPFLPIGAKVRIIKDNGYFDSYVFNHKFDYDGAFTSTIETPALTEQEIKTKQNVTLKEALKNTQIEVNKQNQTITSVVTNVNDQNERISQVTQTVGEYDITLKNIQNSVETAVGTVETLSGTVTDMSFNFSTKGLNIGTSSDPNNSLLDNTGIKVYNYEKLNAIFNDKGSGVKKLIVTETAQIGYLKFIKAVYNNESVTEIYHLKNLVEQLEDLEVDSNG